MDERQEDIFLLVSCGHTEAGSLEEEAMAVLVLYVGRLSSHILRTAAGRSI
jgi:hypothetical protein